MPLENGKSESAFRHNAAAEIHAGKPRAQAVAIAYSVKAKADHKHAPAKGNRNAHGLINRSRGRSR